MSNLQQTNESGSGLVAIPMDEQVVSEPAKRNCWECNFAEQFPISSVDNKANIATVIVGPPHLDYKIITHLKNQKMDGESTLISDKSVLIATLTFVEGVANGPCTIFDENGKLFFEGSFVNGYRQGKGKEYDESGNVVYDGLFEKGVKLLKMTEMDGYWKEYDSGTNLKSVSKKDDRGNNDGICFYYENGKISRLSEWHEGKEVPFNGYFKLYDEANRRWIEGEYKDGIRNGVVKELDENGRLISEGFYLNGVKLNVVRLNEMDGYWKESDENGNLKSVFKLDKCGRYEGVCYFYENGKVKRIREWHDGKETPYCGYFKLYDISQSKWVDGYYNGGIISRRESNTEMKGYCNEFDDNGNLIHICEIDDNGNYNGICYYFENGVLQKICRWEGGKEIPFNGYYKVYNVAQNKLIEGNYGIGNQSKKILSEKMEGYWKEYDENGKLKCICKKDDQGRYEDICYFYENDIIIKISEWHEGKEISLNGVCKVYDEPHNVWYEGEFRNGLLDGECTEYDENDAVIFEGYYKNGNKLTPMENKRHYWEERDSNGNLCRICQLDKERKYNGLCYQYHDNQIVRVSRWKDDKETEVMKLFANGIMTELKNGKKHYVGEFNDSIESNYQREGKGEEYKSDGETLLYKGNFKKGKRNGRGKFYRKGEIAFDGEWKDGLQRMHYLLIIGLILAFVISSTAAGYYYGNVYIGTILIGIYATALCFYLSKYAGVIASGLLLIMIGFFIHLIAGIVISVVVALAAIFYINVSIGVIPVGLLLIAICMYFNTYAGIFAIGLFVIYLLYYIVTDLEWPKPVLYYSAGGIMFACLVVCLIMGLMDDTTWKYIVISLVLGLLLMYIVLVTTHYLKWKKDVVYFGIGAIILIVLNMIFAYGSKEIVALKYVLVFTIGLSIYYIAYMLAYYNHWEDEVMFISAGMILFGCIFSCLVIAFGHTKPFKITMIVIAVLIVLVIFGTLIYNGYSEIVCGIVCVAIIVGVIIGIVYVVKNVNTGDGKPDSGGSTIDWSSIWNIILSVLKVIAVDIIGIILITIICNFCPNDNGYAVAVFIGMFCWLYTISPFAIFSWVQVVGLISLGIGVSVIFYLLTRNCNDCKACQLWCSSFTLFLCFNQCHIAVGHNTDIFQWLTMICFFICCCTAIASNN